MAQCSTSTPILGQLVVPPPVAQPRLLNVTAPSVTACSKQLFTAKVATIIFIRLGAMALQVRMSLARVWWLGTTTPRAPAAPTRAGRKLSPTPREPLLNTHLPLRDDAGPRCLHSDDVRQDPTHKCTLQTPPRTFFHHAEALSVSAASTARSHQT